MGLPSEYLLIKLSIFSDSDGAGTLLASLLALQIRETNSVLFARTKSSSIAVIGGNGRFKFPWKLAVLGNPLEVTQPIPQICTHPNPI